MSPNMRTNGGLMRRLSSLFSRPARRAPQTAAPRKPGVEETICAPKPVPRRCLNEAGHKAVR